MGSKPTHIDVGSVARLKARRGADMTTAEFTATLREKVAQDGAVPFARAHGWMVLHINDSRRAAKDGTAFGDTDTAGFPDMLAIRGDRLVVAEFKKVGKAPRENQADWLAAFTGLMCGCDPPRVTAFKAEVYVWTPQDGDAWERVLR